MSTSKALEDAYNEYEKAYNVAKMKTLEKKAIRNCIRPFYDEQDEKIFRKEGLVIRESKQEARKFKPEAFEYLEDVGLLPFAVKIKPSLTQYYNLDAAKINVRETLHLYAGGIKPALPAAEILKELTDKYSTYDLEDLTDFFKRKYSEEKLAETTLEAKKKRLQDVMTAEKIGSVKSELGTIKIVEKFDFDINKIFDFVAGKKELYAKQAALTGPAADSFEILLMPDGKKATLPGKIVFPNGQTLRDIVSGDSFKDPAFIKKSQFNNLIKAGFKGYRFEIEIDPMEFFKDCELAFGKVEELTDRGLLDPREMDVFIEKDPENDKEVFEVLTEASSEKRREMFDEKLMRRAKNFDYAPSTPNPFANIELDSFSF